MVNNYKLKNALKTTFLLAEKYMLSLQQKREMNCFLSFISLFTFYLYSNL
ncbi:hypothetical protein HMPREF9220_0340 [Dialister micraerophilus UPII 345-E]|uniref:Uncharacterized protein n=1 Tax=Dialister micraerophilus UPII 345-E TaxID=910314 RepID=E4L9B7_9FIRM|nr:hypothetical protein HMPREF9220_0340 [Dialister micraerophilus UPII 345-E]